MDLQQWLAHPESIGATALLIAAIVGFYKGLVVPRWMFDKVVKDCNEKDERITRLMDQLERQLTGQEAIAQTVAKVVRQP